MTEIKEENVDKKSTVIIAGLILSIIGLLLSAVPVINNFAFLLGLIALILGFMGFSRSKKQKNNGRTLSVVIILLSVLTLAIVLLSQSFYSNEVNKVVNEANESIENSTGKNTDQLLKSDLDVKISEFKITEGEFGIVTTELPVTITNKNPSNKSYAIQIEAVDSVGKRLKEDTVYANNLGSSQSQDFKIFQFIASTDIESLKNARFKVYQVSQY